MKFIPAEDFIDRVKNIVPYFFESGLVDDSLVYNELAKYIGFLGDRVHPIKTVTLDIKDSQACLPDDFLREILVYACSTYKVAQPVHGIITYEQRICEVPACHSQCQYCSDDNGLFQIIQRRKDEFFAHKDLRCLVKQDSDTSCATPSLHKDGYKIEDKVLKTAFSKGSVFLEYKSDSGELMVPDYAEILDWLEAETLSFVFKRTWYNMEDSTYQRMQYAVQDAAIKKANAIAFWRRRDMNDFKDLKRYLVLRNSQLDGITGSGTSIITGTISNPKRTVVHFG